MLLPIHFPLLICHFFYLLIFHTHLTSSLLHLLKFLICSHCSKLPKYLQLCHVSFPQSFVTFLPCLFFTYINRPLCLSPLYASLLSGSYSLNLYFSAFHFFFYFATSCSSINLVLFSPNLLSTTLTSPLLSPLNFLIYSQPD